MLAIEPWQRGDKSLGMTKELSGRRIVVPETRELGQLLRMLEERGADTVPCPMIAIRDAPDITPVAEWLRRFDYQLIAPTYPQLTHLLAFGFDCRSNSIMPPWH